MKNSLTLRMFTWLSFFIILGACQSPNNNADANTPVQPAEEITVPKEEQLPVIQEILDSALVKGTILLYDPQEASYYSNDFGWARKGQLPASTYKIAHSLIALETGVMAHDSVVIKWDGEPKWVKSWEQDLTFRQAFQYSCLPCYRQIAPQVGIERMTDWLAKLDYGMSFQPDSSNLDLFWVAGDWRITPFQQIDFLQRFYNNQLSVSARSATMVKEFMILDQQPEYTLRGKTGWSVVGDHNNGWFVGYLEHGNQVYYLATNVEPLKSFDMRKFPSIRKSITLAALGQMGWM